MYNQYIPTPAHYGPIPAGEDQPRPEGGLGRLLGGLFQGEGGGEKLRQSVSALLKSVGLKDLDAGDILLGLIVLLLILEDGDDLDLVIALALMILFGLEGP